MLGVVGPWFYFRMGMCIKSIQRKTALEGISFMVLTLLEPSYDLMILKGHGNDYTANIGQEAHCVYNL